MATKKISELPLVNRVSGSQVAGGSVLPIVIGGGLQGTTNQISVEDFSIFVNAYNAHTGAAGNIFTGPQTINNNVTITGKLTVNELVATYETASIIYSEGGNIFGNELIDKQQFTGSSNFTGSVFINGQNYTTYSSSNSTVFTNFSSSNSNVFTNFSSSNSTYNTTFSSSNAAYVTALSSSNSSYNTIFSSSNSSYNTIFSSSNSSYNTIFSSSNSTTITAFLAGTNSELARVYQATASIQAQTASLLQFTASQDGRNFIISQYTSSTDAHIVGISAFTSSQLAVNLGNAIYTASVDSHIVGISTYTSSVRDTLARVHQATESIQFQTASLLAFTASQDSRNFTLSQVTGSFRGEIGGLEAYSASLKAAAIVSSSTQVQNYDLFALNSNLYISTGSLIGITNGLMAFTASLDNAYATDAQLYPILQATRSLELHSGSMVGVTNGLMALTASMKAQAIVSSSQQITNYYKFAETASANTTFYGGINVTDYSKFGKTGIAKALDVFGGISVTGSVITQQNSIGSFVGSYYTQWDSFGSQGGDGNASVGYFVGTFNDDRKLRLLSDADILLTHGINKKIQVAKASVGTSKVEITGSFNVTGSSTTVGNFEVLNGGITGSILATNGVLSGSAQIGELTQIAGIEAYTASLKAAAIVSSSTQVQNYDVFALNSNLYNSTGSIKGEIAGIEAYTASLKGAIEVSGQNVNVLGMITAQQFNVTYVSSSVMYQSGSNKFGDDTGDKHQFTGSLNVSGGLLVNGTSAVIVTANTAGNSTLNLVSTNSANSGKIQFGGATFGATIEKNSLASDSGLVFNSYHGGAEGYTFQSNGTNVMKLTSAGRIGLEVPNPDVNAKLHIADTANGYVGMRLSGSGTYTGTDWTLYASSDTPSSATDFFGIFNNSTTDGATSEYKLKVYKDGNVNITNGNLVMGTAGKGIDFSANSNAAGMTSELLNDYEEGTWSPTIRGSGTAGTYELATDYTTYTKIGRQVTLNGQIKFGTSVTGGGTGYMQILGAPFTKAANTVATGAVRLVNINFTGDFVTMNFASLSAGTTLFLAETVDNSTPIDLPISAAVANAEFAFTITYFV